MKDFICALLMLWSTFCLAQDSSAPATTPLVATAGERLSFIFSMPHEDGEAARQHYRQGVYAQAQPQGLKALGQFPLADNLYGEHEAERLAVLSMPSGELADQLRRSSEYVLLKPSIKEGWREMEVIDVDLQENIALTLFSDRYYTIAKVWVDSAETHEAYVEHAAPTRAQLGIRILATFEPSGYASLDETRSAPYKVVLVEWPSRATTQAYLDSAVLSAIRENQGTGIQSIEWYGFRI